ncbi:MAG: pentapeptide repeat-containing protein [Oscillospiraceae bacterium]|nr:pentapeptide repeat-containing protein [Oscillospiraceae bacterium]
MLNKKQIEMFTEFLEDNIKYCSTQEDFDNKEFYEETLGEILYIEAVLNTKRNTKRNTGEIMTKEGLKKILDNRKNWSMFEELANERDLNLLPTANLVTADLSFTYLTNANLKFTNLKNAELGKAYFGDRKLVNKEEIKEIKKRDGEKNVK